MSGLKDKDEYNAYMRIYMKARYHKRRAEAITQLGGVCVRCGSDDQLEFDHRDRATKIADIAKIWTYAIKTLREEIEKCQLLCQSCHQSKTLTDLGRVSVRGTHGTLSAYNYCKCEECRGAKRRYMKEYNKTRVRKRDRNKVLQGSVA
jgi:hypothetical protein